MTDQKPKDFKSEMPREGWVSDNDACLIFDSEEDARTIGHGNLTRYIRADLCHPAPKTAMGVDDVMETMKRTEQSCAYIISGIQVLRHKLTSVPLSTAPPLPSEAEKLAEATKRALHKMRMGYISDDEVSRLENSLAAYEQSKKDTAK